MKPFKKLIRGFLSTSWRNWEKFWFETDGNLQIAAFRKVFAAILFFFYSIRAIDLNFFFGESGIAPLATFKYLGKLKYAWTFLEYVSDPNLLIFFHTLFLVSLAMMVFGIFTQGAAFAAFILNLAFLHRNFSAGYGADMIATYYLFYLAFADHRPGKSRRDWRSVLSSVAFRFGQIQLCVIYAYSGIDKLQGAHWWQGIALWDVVANSQIARFQMIWAHQFPLTIAVMTYLTLAWEIYFPALIWVSKMRLFMLLFGVLFHMGIGTLMVIPFFAALMISTYILFLTQSEITFLEKMVKHALNKMGISKIKALAIK